MIQAFRPILFLSLLCASASALAQTVGFAAATYRVGERSNVAIVTVVRLGGTGAASVDFSTDPWPAAPSVDFTPVNGVLRWIEGDVSSKTVEILILQDAFEEEPQDFRVILSNPVGAALGEITETKVIIEDPSVELKELYGSYYPVSMQLDLIASVAGFAAVRVEFLEAERILGVSESPREDGMFAIRWEAGPRGNYTLRARAVNATGQTVTSLARTILIFGPPAPGSLPVVYVDRNNLTGAEDGAPERPFSTIQRGIDNAAPGGVVRVAGGDYPEAVLIANTWVRLAAGYRGALPVDYQNLLQGDFSAADPARYPVRIMAGPARTAFGLFNAQETEIEGFVVSGAARGFLIVAETAAQSSPKLRRNIITNNGEGFRMFGGGAIHAENSRLELRGNEISFNKGGRGAGVLAVGQGVGVQIHDNLIRGNIAYDDHGGGLYLGAGGEISHNRIEDNEVGRGVEYGGWGGGLIVFGDSNAFFPLMRLSYNILTGNLAGNGSAEFFDEGAQAIVEHELIYDNRAPFNGGGAIYVDGCCNTRVLIDHCTVVNNEGYRFAGNGLNTDTLSSAEIKNSIFWNNGGGVEFSAIRDSTLQISYTISDEAIVTADSIVAGPGNLRLDPLFADVARKDFRLKTTRGRWSPEWMGMPGSWVIDAMNSPGIDAGDPVSDFAFESLPNGGRADMGVYGNRAETHLTASVAEGRLQIAVKGANGRAYQLQRRTNSGPWTDVTLLTSTTGELQFSETLTSDRTQFFRLQQ